VPTLGKKIDFLKFFDFSDFENISGLSIADGNKSLS